MKKTKSNTESQFGAAHGIHTLPAHYATSVAIVDQRPRWATRANHAGQVHHDVGSARLCYRLEDDDERYAVLSIDPTVEVDYRPKPVIQVDTAWAGCLAQETGSSQRRKNETGAQE